MGMLSMKLPARTSHPGNVAWASLPMKLPGTHFPPRKRGMGIPAHEAPRHALPTQETWHGHPCP
jgi:hypothetical protein